MAPRRRRSLVKKEFRDVISMVSPKIQVALAQQKVGHVHTVPKIQGFVHHGKILPPKTPLGRLSETIKVVCPQGFPAIHSRVRRIGKSTIFQAEILEFRRLRSVESER